MLPAPFGRFTFPALSIAAVFRCHLFPLAHCKSSFICAFTVIFAGLAVVAVIFPVIGAISPVPYWVPSKKFPFKALALRFALETTFSSFNFPLLSVASKVTVKSSPA